MVGMAPRTDTGTGAPLIVAVAGAESSGKSTLAASLAVHFDAPLVIEVARDYLTRRPRYAAADLIEIARRQQALEHDVSSRGARLVIADTDLVVIRIWWEMRFGPVPAEIADPLSRALAAGNRRYLVPKPDMPWEPDPLRENPHDRDALHARYLEFLARSGASHQELTGDRAERFEVAVRAVDAWLANRAR
jgi:nicotinamide riboside kinase